MKRGEVKEVTMEERASFRSHELAAKLLHEILTEIVGSIPRPDWEADPEFLVEVSRIIASNQIIAHFMGVGLNKVNESPDLGLTQVSINYIKKRKSKSKIFDLIRKTNLPQQLDVFKEATGLNPHQLAKLLEAIHEITVYGALRLSFENGALQIRFDETDVRRQRGAFYTPAKVTRFICENTLGHFMDEKIDYLSKSLGSGKCSNIREIQQELNSLT